MNNVRFDAGVPSFGTGVLYFFIVSAALSLVLAVVAGVDRRGAAPRWLRAARMAALGTCALVALDVLLLLYAFLSHDFRIRYVAHYSDRSMPTAYLVTALWGGQDGSLLWWTFLLSAYTSVCVLWLRGRMRELAPWVIATLMSVQLFFGILMVWAANPFAATFAGAPLEGEGLNPALQNFYMAIHPPSLYVGFVGCAVPFAFAVAALITGRLGQEWVQAVRRWVLFAWVFLSLGNVLGMLWAYEELGWGGFWAWDPVENAACLPWWTLTAFLHSVMIQERRGILKVWNVSLVIASFFLTIFGTFLTRSGLISSVHSFAQSDIGIYFVYYMVFILLAGAALVLWRLPLLRKPAELDAVLSRESMFVANNWMLLGICVFITVATTWPKVSEWLWDERLTVGPTFYNAWLAPVGVVLLALIGIGTLTPWRKGSPKLLLRAFRGPLAAGVTAGVAHGVFGRWAGLPAVIHLDPIYDVWTRLHIGPLSLGMINVGRTLAWLDGHLPAVAVGVLGFNTAAVAQEFYRGAMARSKAKHEALPTALGRLVSRNRRRYGGYIVHIGFFMMFLGWVGAGWRQETEAMVRPGQTFTVGGYTLRYEGTQMRRDATKREVIARVHVRKGDRDLGVLTPSRNVYTARPEQPTTEVAIRSGLREDLYVMMATVDPATKTAHLKAFVNPFTVWIWLGALVLIAGVLVAMWPEASVVAVRALSTQPAKMAVAAAAGVFFFALNVTSAHAQNNHDTSGGGVDLNQPTSPEEHRLFGQVRCMCGDCPRESLATCTCGWAASARDRFRARLRHGESIQSIIDSYVERYGVVALAVPPDRGHNKGLYVLPLMAMVAGGAGAVALARRWVKRRSLGENSEGNASVSEKSGSVSDDKRYDDRIDEELRGNDD